MFFSHRTTTKAAVEVVLRGTPNTFLCFTHQDIISHPHTMLSYTDLKKGVFFLLDGDPYEVLDSEFLRMQQRQPVVRTRIKNLRTGKLYDRSFQPSNTFVEAEMKKHLLIFLYQHRGEYIFCESGSPKNRFSIPEDTIGNNKKWLKPNSEMTALFFDEQLLNLTLPIKMDFKVTEAPPGLQGDRSQSGTKTVTIETGATVQAPLFINTGDLIRINTETGEYVERAEKA